MITKEEFEAYERIRVSGVTNMFVVNVVEDLSGLSREKILEIIHDYSALREKYMPKEES